jgi:putative transcriptional regulator
MERERRGLFDKIAKGLEDGIAHERGERKLRVRQIVIPDPPKSYSADDIRRLRTQLKLSQPGFARLLQVSPKTVQSWEQGARSPRQSAARLLQFIEHPEMLVGMGDA